MNSAAPEREGNLDLAVIGNSRIAALVDQRARIVWWCFPRFDSNPIFSRLLAGDDEKGFCEVALADLYEARSQYVRNTALVETILTNSRGAKVRVTDFAPRFERYGRIFRPPQLIRRIEPIAGLPRIAIKVRPTYDYGRPVEEVAVGSNHIRYIGDGEVMRLTTDAPLSYVVAETSFALTRPVSLILGQDDPFPAAIDGTCREFVELTGEHWREWVRHLGVPFEWQSAVIRAAITLKLCNYEETGAIVAALTTSIPEAPRTPRTWDYRYCWLRDAFFVVDALNRLGATHTMESYINYITTVAVEGRENMQPVQGVVPFTALDEVVAPNLKGYLGTGRCASAIGGRRNCSMTPMAASCSAPSKCSSTSGCRKWAIRLCSASSRRLANGRENSRSSRTPAFGNIVGESGSTPIRRRCAGPPATASARSRAGSICRSARNIGRVARAPSQAEFSPKRGDENTRRLHRRSRPA